eukprot:gene26518-biopygen3802
MFSEAKGSDGDGGGLGVSKFWWPEPPPSDPLSRILNLILFVILDARASEEDSK